MKKSSVYMLLVFLFTVSCDSLKDADNVIIPENHSFHYEIIDEQGNSIEHFSDKRAGEFEIEVSVGLFGDNFISPEIAELITAEIPITPDQLRRDQIYLHAEREVEGEIHHITLNFRFQQQNEWQTGSHYVIEQSEEFLIQRLRFTWERFREQQIEFSEAKQFPFSNTSPLPGQHVSVNYLESGFDGLPKQYFFNSLGGVVDLEEVHDQFLIGRFTIELLGLPSNIFQMVEFPQELDTVIYTITGNFVVLHGDYNDLAEIRADLGGIQIVFI